MIKTIFLSCLIASITFAKSSFVMNEKNSVSTSLSLEIESPNFQKTDGFDTIISDGTGKTMEVGKPELPSYSVHIQTEPGVMYDIEYSVSESQVFENIHLYPTQSMEFESNPTNTLSKDDVFYTQNKKYPLKNMSTSQAIFRGISMQSIEFIPYEYDAKNKKLTVFTQVDFSLTKIENNEIQPVSRPKSEVFENIASSFLLDYDSNRDGEYQTPSILYISGSNLADHPQMQTLVDWRKLQGYEVHVISVSEIGYTNSSIKAYIQTAYDTWENPPEFVCFIGDANGSVSVPTYIVGQSGWYGAQGEGDFPYSLLEGDDLIPEIIIGRMSVRSSSEFVTVVNKIIGYERGYAGEMDWVESAALVGDPYDSGISTVITNEYIEQLMDNYGIEDIRTKYSGSNFDSWMQDQINSGISYLNYRGFYGFSGFTSNEVNGLSNGYKLPFITTLTCATGSFEEEATSIIEDLFRAGTSVNPKGGVAVIGTAQPYTHTAFNNIVDMGIYEGIFIHNAQTAGEALVYGELALLETYPHNPNNNVYYFSTWNNLMGDPATQLWTDTPKNLHLSHDSVLNNGSDYIQFEITDDLGLPVGDAKVTLVKGDSEIFDTQTANENGIVSFNLNYTSLGDVNVLATCQNCIPEESSFEIISDLPTLSVDESSMLIIDNGNNDQIWNAGEEVSIQFEVLNQSMDDIENILVSVQSNSSFINADANVETIPSILGNSSVLVQIIAGVSDVDTPDMENSEIVIQLEMDGLVWNYYVPIPIANGYVELSKQIIADENNNGLLDRGETVELDVLMVNLGSIPLTAISGEIEYQGDKLVFSETQFNWSNLNSGQSTIATNSIQVTSTNEIINGTVISIPVNISTSEGYSTTSFFQLEVGEVSVNDPLGPDNYGYYIYDSEDNLYEQAPEYNWIEIEPSLGGNGVELDISDNGNNQDESTTVDLPFTFTFYGVDYHEITVCSNGWISFGETPMESFRNYTLPGPGGPSPIVAVFWDDLKTTSGSAVYYYYNVVQDYVVIEWSDVRTYWDNSRESFQIILYDSDFNTPTGDDEMKLQYKDFNNTSVGDYPVGNYDGAVIHGAYCTVGIEDQNGTDGLQYTFNDEYPTPARELEDGMALFITTQNASLYAAPTVEYSDDFYAFELAGDGTSSADLAISNTGESGSILNYEITVSPFENMIGVVDGFGYAWSHSNILENEAHDWVDISEDQNVNTLSFEVNDESPPAVNIGFEFPFYGENYSQCIINPNGWIGFSQDHNEWYNEPVFSDNSPRNAILAFWDDLNPVSDDNEVGEGYVRYLSTSEYFVVWYDHVIHWSSNEKIYDFQIVLYPNGEIDVNYRDMIGDVTSATVGIVDESGENGQQVAFNQNFIEDEHSIFFRASPNWLNLTLETPDYSQSIPSGESAEYSILVSSENLNTGIYEAYISINTNTINDINIPIELHVNLNINLGDINNDSIINVLDIVQLVSFIMGDDSPTSFEEIASDYNEDGIVDVIDIVLIINVIMER